MIARVSGMKWALAVALAAAMLSRGAAAEQKFVLAVPGIPPVFLGVLPYVAEKAGFFKKYGLDVEVKPFDTGATAARAVVAGQIDAAMATTPIVINMDSNAKADLVGIYGLENPDWIIASTDPALAKCADIRGQNVGVDAVGGSRAIALKQMLVGCKLGLQDVSLVALSSNVGAAMVAGQLKVGVLHLDDFPTIERELGRKLTVMVRFQESNPVSHINMVVARAEKLKSDRDSYVRLIAALIEANAYLRDPRNLDAVAEIAAVTGRTAADIKVALPEFVALDYWPSKSDGLAQANLEAMISAQVEVGGIKQGTPPVAYDRLVDRSVWRDAQALVAKK